MKELFDGKSWLVFSQGAKLIFAGLGIGLAPLILDRFLASYLFGMRASDPTTMFACSVLLVATAVGDVRNETRGWGGRRQPNRSVRLRSSSTAVMSDLIRRLTCVCTANASASSASSR